MKIECGPKHDKRILNFILPVYPDTIAKSVLNIYCKIHGISRNYKIGVLVSGGIDSALLYYLLLYENQFLKKKFEITPYTILRKEGSKNYAIKVINYINSIFNIPCHTLNVVGDATLSEFQQVESGAIEVLLFNDFLYTGIIEARPEHSINWIRHKFSETFRKKYPLLHLQKSHVIDLIYTLSLEPIFQITHSCAVNEITPCLECNGCRERKWGFLELDKTPV